MLNKACKSVALTLVLGMAALLCGPVAAQESVCARVKIEIKQELTLERQAFDAELRITNSLPATPLTEVSVDVKVTDEMGTPVAVTSDPNDLNAKFFLRQTQKQNIDNTTGTGQVAPQAMATINWLLIPAPGSAGNTPFGKRYLVGATLRYRFGTEVHVMELNPDSITVKPLPSLTLDYFLTRDIVADDPFTAPIEAPEPYTLGVRVKNSGMAPAQELKIASAQPRIIENLQGLPISFQILGSYVQDLPASNSLLINFGDIPSSSSKMGRWQMESNLAGTFVDFTATFTHADELGGALTSLLQATNTHLLVRDVRVDLPGRDVVRDFLAADGTALNIYESEGQDSAVTDRSAEATLTTAGGGYRLSLPATAGFFYVRKPDPYGGQKLLGPVLRADAKAMAVENVWLSKVKNADTKQWEYWFNVFDVNSPGSYDLAFREQSTEPRPPVLQFIPDRMVKEKAQLGFLVEASSPNGKAVTLTAEPLPTGATFHDQGGGIGVFDWTPAVGQVGDYVINYRANDGSLSGTRSAKIRVESVEPPPGPAIPTLVSPLSGAEIASLRPQLQVLTGEASNDPTQSVLFELYADAGLAQKLEEITLAKNPVTGQPTVWTPTQDLNDNTRYYWRARSIPAAGFNSDWVYGEFFVNLFNNAPDSFNLSYPAYQKPVDSETPTLIVTNATDRDGDVVKYVFEVFNASGDYSQLAPYESSGEVVAGSSGETKWTMSKAVREAFSHFWRVTAIDEHGARTVSSVGQFYLPTMAEGTPVVIMMLNGKLTRNYAVLLTATASDAQKADALTIEYEVDTEATFNSSNRKTSGSLAMAANDSSYSRISNWTVADLADNQRYFWRARVSDGVNQSRWHSAEFVSSLQNDAPSPPGIRSPGSGAWIANDSPFLVVASATDVDGDAITYEYEVYDNAQYTGALLTGSSSALEWPTRQFERDKKYYWRVRARDSIGAASGWQTSNFYISPSGAQTSSTVSLDWTGGAVLAPSTVEIPWTTREFDGGAKLAFFHAPSPAGGTKIVEGIDVPLGTTHGSFTWNLPSLPPGPHYLNVLLYSNYGSAKGYAGPFVVPTNPQLGGFIVNPGSALRLTEGDGPTEVAISLSRLPAAHNVVLAISEDDQTEVYASPRQLTFTQSNWSTPQIIKLTPVTDQVMDNEQPFAVTIGATSWDPDYIGIKTTVTGTVSNVDTVPGSGLHARVFLASKKRSFWSTTYFYNVIVSNSTVDPVAGAIVRLTTPGFGSCSPYTREVRFGRLNPSETLVSTSGLSCEGGHDKDDAYLNFQVTAEAIQ